MAAERGGAGADGICCALRIVMGIVCRLRPVSDRKHVLVGGSADCTRPTLALHAAQGLAVAMPQSRLRRAILRH